MSAAVAETAGSSSSGSLHNGPTSIWIPLGKCTSEIDSTFRALDEDSSLNNTSLLSLGSDFSGWHSSNSELHFSKRLSGDLSEEARQQTLKPASFHQSIRKSQRMFPVSRLRFSILELIGRDDEKELLETCLNRVTPQGEEQGGSRELVLISGNAGTGKTALASALAKSVKRLHGLYVKGKFDIYLRDEPYSGIAVACREICGRILLMRDNESFDKIREELIDKLGSENLCLLINVIPELAEIVGDEVIMDDMKKQTSVETKARFNFAFRILIQLVASHFAPLVILLDDLQWSDAATLDLLQVLISDRDNPSLMVIAIYRSNEVDESHSLSPFICELKRTSEQDEFNVTEIQIGNLSTSQVNEVIMSLLSIDDPEKTRPLADLCYKRTYGNVFSLLIFLKMLQSEGLLHYSLGKFKWGWDEQKILSTTAATSNVVDLMRQKIEKLPASVGQRLSIAACLGFSFEPAILNTVWTSISRRQESADEAEPEKDDDIGSFLALVEQEGFLEVEPGSSSAYRWIHDKVQEAAISLVPPEELPILKAQVGTILVRELDDKYLDAYIFTVVNLLYEGGVPKDEPERVQLAKLSLRASKKAQDQSAFESADKYATIGVSVLPMNKWSNHYELTLDLYSTATETACYLGNIVRLETCYKEVIDQKDRPLSDKLRVYHVMISYMGGALGRPNDAIELIVEILAHYNVCFPKRKAVRFVSTLSGFLKAKCKMNSLRQEDISNLPMMTDPVHLEMMRLLDQLFMTAYLAENDLMPLSIFASIQLTLEHGLCEYSAARFAGLALLVGVASGDMALASKTGTFARLVMNEVECKHMDARAELWLNAFVFCWTDPIARMSSRFLRAYETGLSVGDNEYACWVCEVLPCNICYTMNQYSVIFMPLSAIFVKCIAQYIVVGFQSGKSLETVEADCKIYLNQMIKFKRETVHADISIYFEMIRNLIGRSQGDPTVLKSEQRFRSHSDHTVLGVFYTCQSILYMYFGEYEKGAKLAIERGDTYAKGVPAHVWIMIETFTRGMLLYVMARTTKKRIYRKEAKRVHKTIKSWVHKGNPNVKHYEMLLNAESAALSGKLDAAEGWYQSSIVSATRQGHLHESAYASERYGNFLMNERNDPEEARHKIDDAIRRYGEWGAAKKVHLLRQQYRDLWVRPSEVVFGSERICAARHK
jgi:predicted ATPase